LCIVISPLMEVAEGFIFMYFHWLSFGIKVFALFHRVSDFGLESVCSASGDCGSLS
jgi:hypothetical protein